MKLIKHTFKQTVLALLPVLLVGSVFIFFMIKHIIYEETDEFLTYEMERIVTFHQEHKDLPEFHQVAAILEGVQTEKPVFKDTIILEPADNEMVPHRELHFTIIHKGQPFTLVLRHLLPGNDDILQGTLIIISGLMLLIFLILLLTVNWVSKRVWNPFHQTLNQITHFKINENRPTWPQTNIEEFIQLNQSLDKLLSKIDTDFRRTREFNENASHELQTHLAMMRATTEELLNKTEIDSDIRLKIAQLHQGGVKLSQVQKSLLLLSKIGNLEFTNIATIDLAVHVQQSLQLFAEAIDLRSIKLTLQLVPCSQNMDGGLADILSTNLIKNAIKHNITNGFINIKLTENQLYIENSGLPFDGNPSNLLERFAKGEKGNMGIGLAIVKQICELYNFSISYQIKEKTIHCIQISFN